MIYLLASNLILWWISITITKAMNVGTLDQYTPNINARLMLLTLPAAFGSWLAPIIFMIGGPFAWWEVFLLTLASIFIGIFIGRFISSKILLFANTISSLFSVIGFGIFITLIILNFA